MISMYRNKIVNQVFLVAILGAVFLLITALLDAFIGVPKLSQLLLHSIWFQLGLIVCLWIIAFLITKFVRNDGGK
jgi:uncharacterized membrane protein